MTAPISHITTPVTPLPAQVQPIVPTGVPAITRGRDHYDPAPQPLPHPSHYPATYSAEGASRGIYNRLPGAIPFDEFLLGQRLIKQSREDTALTSPKTQLPPEPCKTERDPAQPTASTDTQPAPPQRRPIPGWRLPPPPPPQQPVLGDPTTAKGTIIDVTR